MAESKEKDKLQKQATNKSQPKDAQVMAAVLKDMGVLEYEPRIINQMLEFTYRYVTDVLDDAKVYSNHASKKGIDVDDVKLAIQCRLDHSFTTPPPRDLLMDVARHKNSTPLPVIKPYIGPKLPPDRYCLSSTNYKLKSTQKKSMKVHLQNSAPRFAINSAPGKTMLGGPALTLVTRNVSQPTVTIQRPPTLTTPMNNMPLIRVTPGMMGGASVTTGGVSVTAGGVSISNMGSSVKRKREDDDYDAI